jgi:prepilin-type N-terminal cleavage/methylation domain-containing protein
MSQKRYKNSNGFTIAELLIALSITGILLAAVAVAFDASLKNYTQNEYMFQAINNSRQALLRITTQLRTAQAISPASPSNECTMVTASGDDITYSFNSTDKKLYLVTNDDPTDSDYVLCDNVTDTTFTKATLTADGNDVKSMQISITVNIGNVSKTLSAAAVRRNLQ